MAFTTSPTECELFTALSAVLQLHIYLGDSYDWLVGNTTYAGDPLSCGSTVLIIRRSNSFSLLMCRRSSSNNEGLMRHMQASPYKFPCRSIHRQKKVHNAQVGHRFSHRLLPWYGVVPERQYESLGVAHLGSEHMPTGREVVLFPDAPDGPLSLRAATARWDQPE